MADGPRARRLCEIRGFCQLQVHISCWLSDPATGNWVDLRRAVLACTDSPNDGGRGICARLAVDAVRKGCNLKPPGLTFDCGFSFRRRLREVVPCGVGWNGTRFAVLVWQVRMKGRVHEILEVGQEGDRVSLGVDWALMLLIVANVAAIIAATEPRVDAVATLLPYFELVSYSYSQWSIFSGLVFALKTPISPPGQGPLRYIVDLMLGRRHAVFPFS